MSLYRVSDQRGLYTADAGCLSGVRERAHGGADSEAGYEGAAGDALHSGASAVAGVVGRLLRPGGPDVSVSGSLGAAVHQTHVRPQAAADSV